MISFFENLSPEILIFIGATLIFFGILNLLILILLKKRWQKKEKTTSPPTSFSLSPPPSSLTIQISEQFQKNLENLILQETSRNLAIAKEKTLRDQEKISQMYLEAVEKFIENLRTKKEEIGNVTAQLLEEFQKEILKTKETIKKESFQRIENELSNLKLNLKEELSRVFSGLEKKTKEELDLAKKEIENYKEKKMKELDEKFYQTLTSLTKSILGRVLDLSTHEDLVLKALEKAKKEGFF